MDTAQWPQGIGDITKQAEKKPRPPQKDQAINCPRCSSTNTKFCYYNNYSLSQPRYFCKTCRRYWTHGGSLRNVPVGGGSRKNKRPSSSSSSSSSYASPSSSLLPSAKKEPSSTGPESLGPNNFSAQNPSLVHEGHDLNLAYNPTGYSMGFSDFATAAFDPQNPSHHQLPVMELLKAGSFVGPNPVYDPSGGFNGFTQNLGFSGDGLGINGLAGYHHADNGSSRNFNIFSFGDHLKQGVVNGDGGFGEHGKGETDGFYGVKRI